VDGYKFLNNLSFQFDHVYGEEATSEDLYTASIKPLVDFMADGGYSTVFAYGQTGSGKTYTMGQAQTLAVRDLFKLLAKKPAKERLTVFVACFEIYGPKCQDLLNNRERLELMENSRGEVDIMGLAKVPVASAAEVDTLFAEAMALRTTSKTDANDTSSRSHSIIQIFLHPPGDETASQPLHGMMSVVDLAGSERGQDTKSHSRQLRTEGAEINKSLLALKECIRAMTKDDAHVSFRASKLTQVLKASFTNKKAMTVMVAAVSPAAWSADHTINTLRYADRVKEKASGAKLVLPIDTARAAAAGVDPTQLDMDEGEAPAEDEDDVDGAAAEEEEAVEEEDPVYDAAVEQLNEAEEQLLAAHIGAVEQNAAMCVDEGSLLASILDKSVVDYDIDDYADKLEAILLKRLSITNELQRRLADFRAKSRKEETVSRQQVIRRMSYKA
jgi:kinesin family protein 2/24